jgi:Adenovirus endoprotease.
MCCLLYVSSFLGAFPSYLLPQHPIGCSGTIIVNTDPHTENGSHWLAIRLQSQSHSSYYFDSYGLHPIIPSIHSFIRRTSIVWDYSALQLQGPINTVSGRYCCLFALHTDRGYTSKQFFGLFRAATADKLVSDMFELEFGPLRRMSRGGQCSGSRNTA